MCEPARRDAGRLRTVGQDHGAYLVEVELVCSNPSSIGGGPVLVLTFTRKVELTRTIVHSGTETTSRPRVGRGGCT